MCPHKTHRLARCLSHPIYRTNHHGRQWQVYLVKIPTIRCPCHAISEMGVCLRGTQCLILLVIMTTWDHSVYGTYMAIPSIEIKTSRYNPMDYLKAHTLLITIGVNRRYPTDPVLENKIWWQEIYGQIAKLYRHQEAN